jgi:glucose/arabinose dehydrogenase
MIIRKLVGLGITAALVVGGSVASPEAAITLVPVLTGLTAPTFVTNARDGSNRLFVVEQGGNIKVLQPGNTTPTVFLDITSTVLAQGLQGLLGLAFHPQFESNRRFFVSYTRKPDGATVIAEYHASLGDSNIADATETVLLVIPLPFAIHNGHMVEFGPDGFLYVGMGDGDSENDPADHAQDITNLLGKILRIDVDHPNGAQLYSSPSSNPFFGSTAGADEIYAYGFRNPWRFSFDRSTGDLYVGDVGERAVEEIDIITLGGNYGWRIWEGTHCTGNDPGLCNPAGFIFPIAEYDHTAGRCAVIGGYVYRGAQSSLPVGSYVYADYCTGEIFVLRNGTSSLALDTAFNISSFGEDESGEVYVVGLGGTVHRITAVVSFADVPPSHIFWPWIEALVRAGLTGGCGTDPPVYCPDQSVTRDQMAVFLLRGIHGAGYTPPAASGMVFTDVPLSDSLAAWIEQLFAEGITAGCGTIPLLYCPDQSVTRGEMAVLLLRAQHGAGYQAPDATGIFADVPLDHPFARWIEQLSREGITGGCGTNPARYCPDQPVTRGQMAVFLVRTFNLPL